MRTSVALALILAGGCQTYTQNRAALVPHSTPMAIDGQPMGTVAQLGLGASNVADPIAPSAGDPRAGDVVPGTQLRGEIALRMGSTGMIWGAYEQGLAASGHAVSASLPELHNGGDVIGAGGGVAWSIPTSNPHWRVGVSTELLFWSVPWVQYTTCVSTNCDTPGYTYSDRGSDLVPTLAFGITPSYRNGPLTVFGGVTARNQPTITGLIYTQDPDSDADVQAGPFNVTLHAGLEYMFADAVNVSLVVHQTVTTDPIQSGPGIGLMVRIPFGGARPTDPPVAPAPVYSPPPVQQPMFAPPLIVPPQPPFPPPAPEPAPEPAPPSV